MSSIDDTSAASPVFGQDTGGPPPSSVDQQWSYRTITLEDSSRTSLSRQLWPVGVIIGLMTVGLIASFGIASSESTEAVAVVQVSPNEVDVPATGPTTTELVQAGAIDVGREPWASAFNADDSAIYLTNSLDNTVTVVDIETFTVVDTLDTMDKPTGIVIDGNTAYVANAGNATVSVFDTTNGIRSADIAVGTSPYGLALDSSRNKLYVSNFDSSSVSVIDVRTRTVVATIDVGEKPYGIAVDPGRGRVYVANRGDNTVSTINSVDNSVALVRKVGQSPFGVAVDQKTGNVFVTDNADGTVHLLPLEGNPRIITVGVGPVNVAIDANTNQALVTNHGASSISEIDLDDLETRQVPVDARPHGLTIHPTRHEVYVTSFDRGSFLKLE